MRFPTNTSSAWLVVLILAASVLLLASGKENRDTLVWAKQVQENRRDVTDNQSDEQTLSTQLKAESSESLAMSARESGSAVRGAILFPQRHLGCANCHTPGNTLLGPELTGLGPEANDAYLVEAMLFPSKVIKKGFETVSVITIAGKTHTGRVIEQSPDRLVLQDASPDSPLIELARNDIDEIAPSAASIMPDGLVDQLKDRQQFLDLLRYMMELRAAGPSLDTTAAQRATGGGELSEELEGLILLDEFQCAACHANDLAPGVFPVKQAPDLAWGSGRINPSYIERFIADPLHVKPGTTMPHVMGMMNDRERRAAAQEITHYVVSLGQPTAQARPQPFDPTAAERGSQLFHSVGCVACHSPREADGRERIPSDSVPLGVPEQKYGLNGLVAFLEDPHAARPSGRMPNMTLSHWEAIDIAHYLLGGTRQTSQPVMPFELDQALAEKGKQLFRDLGCVQCHAGPGHGQDDTGRRNYLPMSQARADHGCLSKDVGLWPRYDMNDEQRSAIRAAMRRPSAEFTERQQIALTLATFKCVACHQRDDLGGIPRERDEYFQTSNPNLGPQGRIPPRLTGVGAKLKPLWMRQVLVSGRTIRPYMMTRMPQFGAENVAHLVDLFQQVDHLSRDTLAEFPESKEMRNGGHELAGTDGLNCIACHTYQQQLSATMPAVDLTEMAERLHRNWFHQYMRDPQRLSPNTVMPSFWPSGRAIRRDLVGGDTDGQIESLWQYLLEGRQARPPRGLTHEPIELVAEDEAVMLRRNYPGIGKRGIGVGYPEQVNLAFDAEQMRLAMIWKGKFADPAGVWRGQGHGTVRPLGKDQIRFAAGPELDDAIAPWSVDEGRPPRHRFRGYTLDDLQRPAFRYRFDNIDVSDYSVDRIDAMSGNSLIRRTLTFMSDSGRENVVFRAAVDEKIVAEEAGIFLVGKTLHIHVDDRHTGQIVGTAAGQELRIPLDIGPGKSELVLEYHW